MFNNIPNDDVTPLRVSYLVLPHIGENNIEDGMNHVKTKPFLEIDNKLENPYGTNPYAVDYENCTGIDELCNKIKKYAQDFTKLEPSTIERDLRYLINMADKNQPFPMDLLTPSYTQYIYHMTWYKENHYDRTTGKNFYGLKQKKEAFELYLKACGIPIHYFHYELPVSPGKKPIEFPNPDLAFQITRTNFYNNKEENWIYQFIHSYNFIVGPRPPAETCNATINGIDWDECSLKFTQQKKHNKKRKIFLEEAFINGKTRKSLKNYIDCHRPKIINQYSGDYIFISPKTGKPFTPRFLGKKLRETGLMIYPKWYPYMARHFCATGRLIESYLEHDPDPIKRVQDFMDHTCRANTEIYTRYARDYYKKYPYNWFKRILKDHNNDRGKYVNELGEKSKQRQNTFVSIQIPSRERYSPEQIITRLLPLNETKLIDFSLVSISLTKPFFFSLYTIGVGS